MKNLIFSFILGVILLTPLSVLAINLGGDIADRAAVNAGYARATETSLAETIGVVIKTALSFIGVIFLVLTVYAGFLWMMARGDEGQVEKAQKIIQSAIIGLVVTVGAYSITAFVVPRIVSKTSGGPVGAGGGNANNCTPARIAACETRCEERHGGNVGEQYEACIAECPQNC
ncbi:MAG: hypothetical protein KBD15_04215 [Candidatus Magasanikbacteria bacterium]|nr:hypothetical protein [Candidatus Magasanikbacteria bacterium]